MSNRKCHNTLSDSAKRIIDANLNRLREGIRVIEDITRFFLNNKEISVELKELRHICSQEFYEGILDARDVAHDILQESLPQEWSRDGMQSVITANFKRAQESSRVLEEIFKLSHIQKSEDFKKIRYRLYDLEKKTSTIMKQHNSNL